MFEEIFTNQGFNHITENILIKLDVQSLWRCRLVCKALHQFIKSLEKSRKLKENDFKIIRKIHWKNCSVTQTNWTEAFNSIDQANFHQGLIEIFNTYMAHTNWIAAFNAIYEEDNFFRRRGLIDLLETYDYQNTILKFDGPIGCESYLNISKCFLNFFCNMYLTSTLMFLACHQPIGYC